MTALEQSLPKKDSAVSFILVRTIDDISSA